MSGKHPILAMAPSIPRIHQSSSTIEIPSGKSESTKAGSSYKQFFGETYPTPLDAITIITDPRLSKQQEAEGSLQEIHVDPASANKFAYSQATLPGHLPAKNSLSLGSRIIYPPNLTTDRPARGPRTCTKSVHKVVFLFCSVALAIIIACIIFVEMKKMQMDEQEPY